MRGDAGQKSRRHRNGQEVGDETELERAGQREHEPDDERQQRDLAEIERFARREGHRQRAGEDRRDRGVRADRQAPARPEQREADAARDQREETAFRRHAAEPGGGHLLGNGDGRERQARERVGAEVAHAPAGEGRQGEPSLRVRHRTLRRAIKRPPSYRGE